MLGTTYYSRKTQFDTYIKKDAMAYPAPGQGNVHVREKNIGKLIEEMYQ
jgi:hypothetical protein